MTRPLLVAFREGEADRCLVLGTDAHAIGRSQEADLMLPDDTVSRQHALVRIADGNVFVDDCDSTNGVFLNGERIKHSTMREGDFLSIGAYTLVLRVQQSAKDEHTTTSGTICIGYDESQRLLADSMVNQSPEYCAVLYRTALLLGQGLSTEEFVRHELQAISDALKARRVTILAQEDDAKRFDVMATISSGDDTPLSRTLVDHVLRTRTALLTENAQADPRFAGSDTVIRQRIASAMCVPLCGTNRVVGVLYVDVAEPDRVFVRRDLDFLIAMGHVLGLAIERNVLRRQVSREERLAVLGKVVAGISHDVRNVLTGINLGVELIKQSTACSASEQAKDACNMIQGCADRIETYLGNMVSFVRDPNINRAPTLVRGLIEDILAVLYPLARERGVDLVFRCGGYEPALLDASQIHRVLMNIIKNAIEACDSGHGAVCVSVSRKANALIIMIEDTGMGMPPEVVSSLPEFFFTTKGKKGTGLGMAVSFDIVERHKGWISVASEVGKGSTFTIVLPDSLGVSESEQDAASTVSAYDVYKRCPKCGVAWPSQDAFLSDPSTMFVQYEVQFTDLGAGQFLFNHACDTTLPVPACDFRHLYNGPVYEERMTGGTGCPGYCLHKEETRPCPARCSCAYVREVLAIIKDWPKR